MLSEFPFRGWVSAPLRCSRPVEDETLLRRSLVLGLGQQSRNRGGTCLTGVLPYPGNVSEIWTIKGYQISDDLAKGLSA